jgi:hypothetical protein
VQHPADLDYGHGQCTDADTANAGEQLVVAYVVCAQFAYNAGRIDKYFSFRASAAG